jgi:hypothetical protein
MAARANELRWESEGKKKGEEVEMPEKKEQDIYTFNQTVLSG